MPNGIDLVLADHQHVSDLFTEFDTTAQGSIIGQVIDALAAHDDAENAALYPLADYVLDDPDLQARSAEAHSAIKRQIDHLKNLEGPPLTDAFLVLRGLVEEHVADEEANLIPPLAEQATPQQIDGLGARILQAKQRGG